MVKWSAKNERELMGDLSEDQQDPKTASLTSSAHGRFRRANMVAAVLPLVVLVSVSCSAEGTKSWSQESLKASTTTTSVSVTTTTAAATTTAPPAPPSTQAPPPPPPPPTTAAPAPTADMSSEELAVAFMRDAVDGKDLSRYVMDPSVITEAQQAVESFRPPIEDPSQVVVEMEPDWLDPNAQSGSPGECQLIGDVTLQCAVVMSRPERPENYGSDSTVYGVFISTVSPDSDIDNLIPVDPYVAGLVGLAG